MRRNNKKKTFRVTFVDNVTANSREDASDIILSYFKECSELGDSNAFAFEEVEEEDHQTH